MDTHHSSAYSRTGVLEEQRNNADPRMLTTQGSRYISDNSWQPPAYGKQIATLEASYYNPEERTTNMEKSIEQRDKNRDLCHSVNTRPEHLESCNRAFPGKAVRKDLQEKEENEKLKEENEKLKEENDKLKEENEKLKEENEKLKEETKKLKTRYTELLSKVMAMHKNSEDMNDPLRLSAVLKRYEMLQLQWEKVRTFPPHCWTYQQGSQVIKKLFDACEEDLQQRIADIFKVLGISPSNDTMTHSKQGIIREIRNLFGQSCHQNYSEVYIEIVKLEGPFKKLSLIKLLADLSMRKYRQLLDAGIIQKPGLTK